MRTSRKLVADLATYAASLVVAGFFILPILWLVSLAVRTPQEIFLGASRFIPENPTLGNFAQVWSDRGFAGYLWNSLLLSSSGAIGAAVIAAPAAYAFSRLRFRAQGALLVAILSVQMVSGLVILIPLYRYMGALGLLETHFGTALIYIAIGIPFTVWLIKAAFDRVPMALDEAAAIDGSSRFKTFWRIILPLAAPGVASAVILNLIFNWSQFLVPLLMLTQEAKWPMSVAIFKYAGSTTASTTQLLAAACLMAIVPVIVCFLVLQRLVLASLMAGAVKQ